MAPKRAARHQKARLEGATVEAVARHLYGGRGPRDGNAGWRFREHFYDHFDSRQDCFLATFDEIVDQLSVRAVGAA
jgi:hypothetical protein